MSAPGAGPDLPAAVLVCAVSAAAGVALLWPPRPTGDPVRASPRPPGSGGEAAAAVGSTVTAEHDLLLRHRPGICLLAAAAAFVFLGGWLGAVGSAVAAVTAWRVLGAREPARVRRERDQLSRQLPHAVDLLAVTLSAGASPPSALAMVADAVEQPLSGELHAVERGLTLGRDPVQVWRELAARPGLGPLGRTMVRAVETGASVSDALHRLASDLHDAARAQAEARARSVGVRAAAPLGLCLLPAFVLTGVVPLVAATVAGLLRW